MKNLATVWLAPPVSYILFPVPKMGWTRREHFSLRLVSKTVISLSQSCKDTSENSTDCIWTGRPETTPPDLGLCPSCTWIPPRSTPLLHCCIADLSWEIGTPGYAVEITRPSKQAKLLLPNVPSDSVNLFMVVHFSTWKPFCDCRICTELLPPFTSAKWDEVCLLWPTALRGSCKRW